VTYSVTHFYYLFWQPNQLQQAVFQFFTPTKTNHFTTK